MKARRAAAPSIWIRLIVGLVGVSLLAVLATGLFIYDRFVATNSVFRDRTLQNDARIIGKLYSVLDQGQPLQLPDFLADNFEEGKGKFAVVSDDGVLLAGSTGVTEALAPIGDDGKRDFFLTDPTRDGKKLYGFTLRDTNGRRPVWVQVAAPASEIVFDSVLEEFIKDVGWIWIPFIFGLLATNLLVARIGLKPLRMAAAQAEAIGPTAVSARLTEDGLPREVFALVSAINRALDRLEVAFQSQNRFIADAAHELRTPVAVLKSHVAILPYADQVWSLKEEIGAMERLVNQLLDSARVDALAVEAGQAVDLNQVAQVVAQQLGPIAINKGKSIEVISAGVPVIISGSNDLLVCALRNLVENAIRFTPNGTAVSIHVESPPALRVLDRGPGVRPEERDLIFKRFWQGGRDRGGSAGLGMDIASRTVAGLGGVISVDEAPGGGAAFTMQFPELDLSAR